MMVPFRVGAATTARTTTAAPTTRTPPPPTTTATPTTKAATVVEELGLGLLEVVRFRQYCRGLGLSSVGLSGSFSGVQAPGFMPWVTGRPRALDNKKH